jgi:hypothetical protein
MPTWKGARRRPLLFIPEETFNTLLIAMGQQNWKKELFSFHLKAF